MTHNTFEHIGHVISDMLKENAKIVSGSVSCVSWSIVYRETARLVWTAVNGEIRARVGEQIHIKLLGYEE